MGTAGLGSARCLAAVASPAHRLEQNDARLARFGVKSPPHQLQIATP
jgi:hypothetical protein